MNLITAIDYSKSKEEPRHIYVLVSIIEKDYPSLKSFLERKISISHWRKISRRNMIAYESKFIKRWENIKNKLVRIDISFNPKDLISRNIDILEKSKIMVIDDSLIKEIPEKLRNKILPESQTKIKKHYKAIILLADNIANIIRKLWKTRKKVEDQYQLLMEFRK